LTELYWIGFHFSFNLAIDIIIPHLYEKRCKILDRWERHRLWDKLELWKQIHSLVDDLKKELREYHNIYNLYGSFIDNEKITPDKLTKIKNDIRSYLKENYSTKINTFSEKYIALSENSSNGYNNNKTLYAYAEFLININDILPTIYNCFPIDGEGGLNNDIHKQVATTIQDWLDTSLRQADQMIEKYIDSINFIANQRNIIRHLSQEESLNDR